MSAKLISFHNGFLGCHDECERDGGKRGEGFSGEEADGEGKRSSHRMSRENDFKT